MTSYALLGFIGSIVAFMFLGGVLKLPLSPVAFVPGLVCWMVGFGLMLSSPSLVCPGCGNDMG